MSNSDDNSNTAFIAKYKAAIKAKLNRQEFAAYLGIKPDSVIRRRLSIYTATGLDLPLLENCVDFDDTVAIDVIKVEKFEEFYKDILYKDSGPETIDLTSSSDKKIYIITAAQNATPIHEPFFAALLKYCELRDAELMVIPYRYKNPTSLWSDTNKGGEWWFSSLEPYLVDTKVKITKSLQMLGQIKTQPTAVAPLSGFDAFTGSDSAILGHPKVQLKTIATPSKQMPKILTTTGACTVENYTDSKAGHKGRFHHNISALVVEVDGDKFHLRHVHGEDDGSFYDLQYHYTPRGRSLYGRVAAFVPGDIHAEFVDKSVEKAMFGKGSICDVLNPETIAYHDIEDFYRRNHHHNGNDVIAFGKHHYGRNNVEEGLQMSADFIDRNARPDTMNLIVRANHDEAFDRWLADADPKYDPENARFYYYMKFHQLDSVAMTDTGFSYIDAFEFWCNNPLDQLGIQENDNVVFLKRDESFVVAGIEIGFHGDKGINGSRGSAQAFSKIGPKTIIGHSHSPSITEGCYQVGLSAQLNLEYASGPSSWLHSHCVVYPNGSRVLLNVIDGDWRGIYDE
jgi:hypothetical protein